MSFVYTPLMTRDRKALFETYNSNPQEIILKVGTYLEERQFKYYGNVKGLCHSILAKNPYASNFLLYFLRNEQIAFPWLKFLSNTLLFFLNTSKELAYETLLILLMKKNKASVISEKLFIVSFFNYDRKESSIFDDLYLAGLQKDLSAQKIRYRYFPKLYRFPRNVFKAKKEFEQIKNVNENFVSPYEIVNYADVFELAYLSFTFYFQNIVSLKPWSSKIEDQCFNKALVENIKQSDVNKFLYYIFAKRAAELTSEAKVILWYENQIIDKCIIKGLRKNKNIEIYGCQFFLVLPQEMNLFPSLFEVENNICPDKIFITQAIPQSSHIPERYFQGVSLRYLYLYKYDLNEKFLESTHIYSVFLGFKEDTNQHMYSMLEKAGLESKAIHIKKHPSRMDTATPKHTNWVEETRRQEEILIESEIVFIGDSGVIFEAMALARQVIILGSKEHASHFIPPGNYRGKMWLLVTEPEEILSAINELRKFRKENTEEFLAMAKAIRSDYFRSCDLNILEVLNIK